MKKVTVLKKVAVLHELKGSSLDMWDAQDSEAKSVVALKVVDITVLCPKVKKGQQALLKYARITRGSLVQLCYLNKKSKKTGSYANFYYEEMGVENLTRDAGFEGFVYNWGISPHELAQIIFQNAPAN